MTIGKRIIVTCGVLNVAMAMQAAVALYGFSGVQSGVQSGVDVTAMVRRCFWLTILILLPSILVGAAVTGFLVQGVNRLLRGAASELKDAAGLITRASGQVATSSQSLAQGATRQAATIEETSTASSEISAMAARNTENSRATAEMVTHSLVRFKEANHSLHQMVAAMDGITGSSRKISKIIRVIDEIAFQTNILALNAAVEAARAGEAGMGFAVVADEVRNLAQRCAQAAKDTAELIEESILQANGGKAKVDEVADAIRSITSESAKMKILVDEISLGSTEQARGIGQISRSIVRIEQGTLSSAASAEESAGAAEQMNAQARGMQEIVERLTVLVDGTSQLSQTPLVVRSGEVMPRPSARPGLRPGRAAAASIATVRSAIRFPPAQSAVAFPTASPSLEIGNFPLDDDFKEF